MIIHAAGREYVHSVIEEAPDDGDVEVSTDLTTWHPTERIDDTIRFLVQGPDATTPPEGAQVITLPLGRTRITARLVDNPEVLIRYVGHIDVYR